ncbi:MAG: DegV family protein [Chloroflexota bacterium]
MRKVALLTDSSPYIPQELIEDLNIGIVPLILQWDDKTYYDSVDIQPKEFYTRLAKSSTIPITSQVTVKQFDDAFGKLLEDGYDVLALLISSGISGTVDSAVQSKKNFPNASIEIVDSQLASMALGFMVLEAARAAKEGASLVECKAIAEAAFPKIGVYFTVDSLKYLHKGGRINTAKRLLGSTLSIKPLMELRDGKIELVESVISRKKAIQRMLDLTAKRIGESKPVRIAVFHALVEEEALSMLETAKERFQPIESILTDVSPAIGTHTGPGTLSIAYIAG